MDMLGCTQRDLTDKQIEEGRAFIRSKMDIFLKNDDDVCHTDTVHNMIDLLEYKPFKERYHYIP